jgi:hypothetical protein
MCKAKHGHRVAFEQDVLGICQGILLWQKQAQQIFNRQDPTLAAEFSFRGTHNFQNVSHIHLQVLQCGEINCN